MGRDNAKIFICNHPDNLLIYKNLAKIIKSRDRDVKIILLKVNHPYFLNFNFNPYKEYFDEIAEFEFIHYKKNILFGFLGVRKFIKKIREVEAKILANFKSADLFLIHSTWLPTNVLLCQLSRNKKISKVTRFILWSTEHQQTKIDTLKTLFCRLYSSFFGCYKVKVTKSLAGQFAGFVFAEEVAGIPIEIVSPVQNEADFLETKKGSILSYPVLSEFPKDENPKKDMVIIFADVSAIRQYREYFSEPEFLEGKFKNLFENIENHYPNCQLYYKPHPSDGKKIMPGINISKYNLFDNSINAEVIFEKYSKKIKAIYSLSSVSVIIGSFFGIPSYAFYKYFFNSQGIEKLGSIFNQSNIQSDFIFHLTDLKQIGQIDNLEYRNSNHLNLENINKTYLKILNI